MKRTMTGLGLVGVGLGLLLSALSACAVAPSDESGASTSAVSSERAGAATGFHAMTLMKPTTPTEQEDVSEPAATTQLKHYGGPVIPNVRVIAVYWGSRVAYQDHLNAFYASVTNSSYFDWLKEYDTSTTQIGRGSFGGGVVITPSASGTKLKDADIQAEISKQIDAHVLPPSDGVNTLYMLHFPPGISLVAPDGSSTSCVQFCAYHGTFKKDDKYVFYGIHPDLAQSGCNFGCGSGSAQDNTTTVASHELIEAVTDPAVGLATDYAPPLAWYNEQKGEIGDICNGRSARVNNFSVQLQWSNTQNKCAFQ